MRVLHFGYSLGGGSTNQDREGNVKVHFIQQDSWVLPGEYLSWAERHGYGVTVIFTDIDGADYQVLVEADYMANATENGYGWQNAENFMRTIMKTESGKRLLRTVFC